MPQPFLNALVNVGLTTAIICAIWANPDESLNGWLAWARRVLPDLLLQAQYRIVRHSDDCAQTTPLLRDPVVSTPMMNK